MTNTVPTPSPTYRAATLGATGLGTFAIVDAILRYFKIAPDYAQEIVGAATFIAPMIHRWIATWYKYSDGRLAVELRYWLGNPTP